MNTTVKPSQNPVLIQGMIEKALVNNGFVKAAHQVPFTYEKEGKRVDLVSHAVPTTINKKDGFDFNVELLYTEGDELVYQDFLCLSGEIQPVPFGFLLSVA